MATTNQEEIHPIWTQDVVQTPWESEDWYDFVEMVEVIQTVGEFEDFFIAHPHCAHNLRTTFSDERIAEEPHLSPLSYLCLERRQTLSLFLLSRGADPAFPVSTTYPDEDGIQRRFVSPMEGACVCQSSVLFIELYKRGMKPHPNWMIHMFPENRATHRLENEIETSPIDVRNIFQFLTNHDPWYLQSIVLPSEYPTWTFMALAFVQDIKLLESFLRLFLYNGNPQLSVRNTQGQTASDRMMYMFRIDRNMYYCIYLFYIHPEVTLSLEDVRTNPEEAIFYFTRLEDEYNSTYRTAYRFQEWVALWNKDREACRDVYVMQTLLSTQLARFGSSTISVLPTALIRQLRDYLRDPHTSFLFRMFAKLRIADLEDTPYEVLPAASLKAAVRRYRIEGKDEEEE